MPHTLDLSGRKGITVFWVLGFLDEYLGRQVLQGDDLVARLYCNEDDKAPAFRRVLERLQREQALSGALRELVVQGCLIEFRSAEISRALNSLYTNRAATGAFSAGRAWTALRVSGDIFARVGRDERLAYLSGVYYRFGRENSSIGFANAHHKAAVVAHLLQELGATRVRRETISGVIPNGNSVHFSATAELREWLAMVP